MKFILQASPSLIGRCRCLFFGDVSWHCLVNAWMEKNKETMWAKQDGALVLQLLNWFIPPCLHFLEQFSPILGPSGLVR